MRPAGVALAGCMLLAALGPSLAPAAADAPPRALPATHPSRVNVGYAGAPPPTDARLAALCGPVLARVPDIDLVTVAVAPPRTQAGCIAALRAQPDVRYAVPDGILVALAEPNDPQFPEQLHLQRIRAPEAWDVVRDAPRALALAILDTGVLCAHPDLQANCDLTAPGPFDACGHGTHVAGIAAAAIGNNEGVAGVANVRVRSYAVMPVATPQYCTGLVSEATQALAAARSDGARIVSMSFGVSDTSCAHDPLGPFCQPLEDAVRAAYADGMLLVAAAGNGYGGPISYPAKFPEVIAVTSTTDDDMAAAHSSAGPEAELAAPGEAVLSTMAPAGTLAHFCGEDLPSYCRFSGTSMAAPQVAGTAALLWSKCPSATRDAVRAALQAGARDLGLPGRDSEFGYGRLDARGALDALAC
jgi:serine protease